MNVPRSNIWNLRNEQATRAGIIQALLNLRTDPHIKFGDPILIFYAGHGGKQNAPASWEAGGPKIEMLIPHDFDTQLHGLDVHGIPDRTVGAMLSGLAKEKGNNIVRQMTRPLVSYSDCAADCHT